LIYLLNNKNEKLFNIAASKGITVEKICNLFNKHVQYGNLIEIYDNINIEYFSTLLQIDGTNTIKTSEYYIKKFISQYHYNGA
jgi:hypothetical protein